MSVEPRTPSHSTALLRIGSFSRLVGVAPGTLRAWEERYGLLRPRRSGGGFRLYSEDEARAVAEMRRHLAAGMAASEAARRAGAATRAADAPEPAASELGRLREALLAACLDFDAAASHRALDDLLARFSLDVVLRDAVVWLVQTLDARCSGAQISSAQERFSARLLERRLLAMASGWELGRGPLVLLARVPAQRHVIGITSLGLALRTRGWRIVSLGDAVRPAVLAEAAGALRPDAVALSIGTGRLSGPDRVTLSKVARRVPLSLGGYAVTPRLAATVGARRLPRDVLEAADVVAHHSGERSVARVAAVG